MTKTNSLDMCPICKGPVGFTTYITSLGEICVACFSFINKTPQGYTVLCADCKAPHFATDLDANGVCPGCVKLNAAKQAWAQQQQATKRKANTATSFHCAGCGQSFPLFDLDSKGFCKLCATGKFSARPFGKYGKGVNVAYRQRPSSTPYSTVGGAPRSTQQTQCSFEWDVARSAYAVKSQYQVNFIEFIKAKIPGSDRAWDPGAKLWFIKEAWYDIMYDLANQLWPGAVVTITRETAERAWREQEAARAAMLKAQRDAVLGPFESALLAFCELCDSDALKAAYRKAAIALHPDKQGGDEERMARLNASWFVIETELKKRSETK